MKLKIVALCSIMVIGNSLVADYNVDSITPDWAKIENEREREAIVRAIGDRWWAVVPYV